MLIEFQVENFGSIRHRQAFSMAASSGNELADRNTFQTGIPALPRLTRSALVYGPNAAGKSTLAKALAFMRRFVVFSAKGQEGDPIKVTPFLLDPTLAGAASEFEVTFLAEGIRYQYGFAADARRVSREWLFAFPEGRPQRWLERTFDPDRNDYVWKISEKVKGAKKTWIDSTRSNALFLSTAVQLNSEQLRPAFNWFSKTLDVLESDQMFAPDFTAKFLDSEKQKQRVLAFLNEADLSILDVKTEKSAFSADTLPKDMPVSLRDHLASQLEGKEIADFKFAHRGVDGASVYLKEEDESDGTIKMFSLAGPWLDVLENGHVLVVDELSNNLHPLLTRYLVGLFNRPRGNCPQLIFTTHDTSLMDPQALRRDQIWFVEKDSCNATQIYPLTDFSPRKQEALAKGYLLGRYGAVPYVGEDVF